MPIISFTYGGGEINPLIILKNFWLVGGGSSHRKGFSTVWNHLFSEYVKQACSEDFKVLKLISTVYMDSCFNRISGQLLLVICTHHIFTA
jgi:hypothetical protein